MAAGKVDTLLFLRGSLKEGPGKWKTRVLPCAPDEAPHQTQHKPRRWRRQLDLRPILVVIVRGLGVAFPDVLGRRREERRLLDTVRDTRTRMHGLVQHKKLPETSLPVVLDVQASAAMTDRPRGRLLQLKESVG